MNCEKTLYPQKELKGFPDTSPTFSKGVSHFLAVSSGPQFTSLLCSHWSPPPRTCAHPPVVLPTPRTAAPTTPTGFPTHRFLILREPTAKFRDRLLFHRNLCSLPLNHSVFSRILLHKSFILCWIYPF